MINEHGACRDMLHIYVPSVPYVDIPTGDKVEVRFTCSCSFYVHMPKAGVKGMSEQFPQIISPANLHPDNSKTGYFPLRQVPLLNSSGGRVRIKVKEQV